MLLHLTDISPESLQSQIIRKIRAMILTGELAAGEALPSIRSMASQQHVSVITVQRSYEELERLGLIVARRGKGFYVCDLTDEMKEQYASEKLIEEFKPIINHALAEGLSDVQIVKTVVDILENKTNSI